MPFNKLQNLFLGYIISSKWAHRRPVVYYLEMRRIVYCALRPHTQQLSEWPLTLRFVQSPFWLQVGLWNRLAFTLSLLFCAFSSKICLLSRCSSHFFCDFDFFFFSVFYVVAYCCTTCESNLRKSYRLTSSIHAYSIQHIIIFTHETS